MSVVVVATITPQPEQVDAVREALRAAVPKVHAEPGCELYALHEGDGGFVMVERWADAEALSVHGKAEALTHARRRRSPASWPGPPRCAGCPRCRPATPARARCT